MKLRYVSILLFCSVLLFAEVPSAPTITATDTVVTDVSSAPVHVATGSTAFSIFTAQPFVLMLNTLAFVLEVPCHPSIIFPGCWECESNGVAWLECNSTGGGAILCYPEWAPMGIPCEFLY